MKYKDMISLFVEDLRVIDCKKTSVERSIALIKESYFNRQWFDKDKVSERKQEIDDELNESVNILAKEITRGLQKEKTGV